MRLAGKLDEWQAAGLIDGSAAAAILAHEDARAKPVALFAVVGLGLLALALGIVSVVAANWDALPAAIKLAGHALLTAAAAAAVILCVRRDRAWAGEGTLFLLGALTLAGIALQSQVYQLTGALWQALAWWAVLMSPALLLLGRTRLTAYAYGLMMIALAIAYRTGGGGGGWVGDSLSNAVAPALVLVALALPPEEHDTAFRAGLFELGLAIALIAASVAHVGWATGVAAESASSRLAPLWLAGLVAAGASALAFVRRPGDEAALIAAMLGGGFVAIVLAVGIPHGDGPAARFVGVLSFAALWGGIAVLATRAGWHRLFRIAVGLLAARLFLVYFELFYSLAFTGVGLIVGGLLLIALAWGWTRIVRREAA